jgi:hypothetical protein
VPLSNGAARKLTDMKNAIMPALNPDDTSCPSEAERVGSEVRAMELHATDHPRSPPNEQADGSTTLPGPEVRG